MELLNVSKEEYQAIVSNVRYIYDSVWFHELNSEKVENIYYLIFKNSKYKCGIIVGIKEQQALMPYSAPFSMIEKINIMDVEEIEEVVSLLENFLYERCIRKIFFRMPPLFYDETFISEIQNVLIRKKYSISSFDLNYQYYISDEQEYWNRLHRNARKNLKKALKGEWKFIHCDTIESKKTAYDVIAINRKSKGYPLRMSWDAVKTTVSNIENDFFLLEVGGEVIASAVVFGVTDDIYQVIYWGDIPNHGLERPMNYLAYSVYLYYLRKGIRVLDIGPSTEDGIPNYGLCSFKKSIGCEVSSKLTFRKELG